MIGYEGDDRAVARALASLTAGESIDHATARVIAAGYNTPDTAPFVTTGALLHHDAAVTMDCIRDGVDATTLRREAASLAALETYLIDREALTGETGPVEGWTSLDIPRHVDYPHQDGMLPDCWCHDESDESEEGGYQADGTE